MCEPAAPAARFCASTTARELLKAMKVSGVKAKMLAWNLHVIMRNARGTLFDVREKT